MSIEYSTFNVTIHSDSTLKTQRIKYNTKNPMNKVQHTVVYNLYTWQNSVLRKYIKEQNIKRNVQYIHAHFGAIDRTTKKENKKESRN